MSHSNWKPLDWETLINQKSRAEICLSIDGPTWAAAASLVDAQPNVSEQDGEIIQPTDSNELEKWKEGEQMWNAYARILGSDVDTAKNNAYRSFDTRIITECTKEGGGSVGSTCCVDCKENPDYCPEEEGLGELEIAAIVIGLLTLLFILYILYKTFWKKDEWYVKKKNDSLEWMNKNKIF